MSERNTAPSQQWTVAWAILIHISYLISSLRKTEYAGNRSPEILSTGVLEAENSDAQLRKSFHASLEVDSLEVTVLQ